MRARSTISALAVAGGLWAAAAAAQDIVQFPGGNAAVGSVPGGNQMARVWLTAPGLLCNDGTTPAIYVRRFQDPAYANNWVIYLQGGGTCGGAEECLDRWSGVNSNFGIQQMSTSVPQATWALWHPGAPPPQGWTPQGALLAIPPAMAAPGIFNPANSAFGGWNRVFAYYCSSDSWSGRKRDSQLGTPSPVPGGPPSVKVHFQGAAIFDEIVARLRAGFTYCLGPQCEDMPSLGDAGFMLLAGSSAGAGGVRHNLDRFRETMAQANPQAEVRGVLDASGLPPTQALPWPATGSATSHAQYVGARWRQEYVAAWDARLDDSCLAENTVDPFVCADPAHVVRHHLTTPFFLRADLNALATNLLPRYPAELARVTSVPSGCPPASSVPAARTTSASWGARRSSSNSSSAPPGGRLPSTTRCSTG